MLVKISEILNVSVSDLLGESIAIKQNDNLSIIALELQKLNELFYDFGRSLYKLLH